MGCFCFVRKKIYPVNNEKEIKNTMHLLSDEIQSPFIPPPPIRIPKHRVSFSSTSKIRVKSNNKHKKYKKKSHTR